MAVVGRCGAHGGQGRGASQADPDKAAGVNIALWVGGLMGDLPGLAGRQATVAGDQGGGWLPPGSRLRKYVRRAASMSGVVAGGVPSRLDCSRWSGRVKGGCAVAARFLRNPGHDPTTEMMASIEGTGND